LEILLIDGMMRKGKALKTQYLSRSTFVKQRVATAKKQQKTDF